MKLIQNVSTDTLSTIISHANELCKTFDEHSNCTDYLHEKIKASATDTYYLETSNGEIGGMGIIELLDKEYGNVIVHTLNEEHEAYLAHLLYTHNKIEKNVLELIQFRSNFNYRDEFLRLGCKEKERVRMIHDNIQYFSEVDRIANITFTPLSMDDNDICGEISYNAHKHRIHIECYDVYSHPKKRADFSKDLRNKKHGNPIDNASLLMSYNDIPIGLIEIVHVTNWSKDMGWIMDVALLPEYQGMGLGKHLIKKSLSELHKSGYSSAGLGVTTTNKNAHQLYESLGFNDYEFFVEIIGG